MKAIKNRDDIYIFSITTGSGGGNGNIRKEEFFNLSKALKIPKSNVKILDEEDLKVNFNCHV